MSSTSKWATSGRSSRLIEYSLVSTSRPRSSVPASWYSEPIFQVAGNFMVVPLVIVL
jgi:hypothetical protein